MKVVTVIVAAVTVTLTICAGSAAAIPLERSGDAAVPAVTFTEAERQGLQAEIDEHLNDYGAGKQIGINQISFDNGGGVLTFPLPGEKKARAIDEPVTPLGVANCKSENACLWSDTNFNGSKIEWAPCLTITLTAPFNTSTGSIHNNQTSGTQTIVYNSSGQVLNASMAPSRINDTGVGTRYSARSWRVCP